MVVSVVIIAVLIVITSSPCAWMSCVLVVAGVAVLIFS